MVNATPAKLSVFNRDELEEPAHPAIDLAAHVVHSSAPFWWSAQRGSGMQETALKCPLCGTTNVFTAKGPAGEGSFLLQTGAGCLEMRMDTGAINVYDPDERAFRGAWVSLQCENNHRGSLAIAMSPGEPVALSFVLDQGHYDVFWPDVKAASPHVAGIDLDAEVDDSQTKIDWSDPKDGTIAGTSNRGTSYTIDTVSGGFAYGSNTPNVSLRYFAQTLDAAKAICLCHAAVGSKWA